MEKGKSSIPRISNAPLLFSTISTRIKESQSKRERGKVNGDLIGRLHRLGLGTLILDQENAPWSLTSEAGTPFAAAVPLSATTGAITLGRASFFCFTVLIIISTG